MVKECRGGGKGEVCADAAKGELLQNEGQTRRHGGVQFRGSKSGDKTHQVTRIM